MFGKKRQEEFEKLMQSASEDRRVFAEEAAKDRAVMTEQVMALQKQITEVVVPSTVVAPSAVGIEGEYIGKSDDSYIPFNNENDKIRAAYALNLCTVSISQIIDYHDLIIMEQEYEAIINNLNLENIIKDEALLNTLKLILDTITYFRIEDGEKKFIEKEYNKKLKNAIWKAVPNPVVILSAVDPIAMAVMLASQIGIGYMNYRKEKNEVADEREKKLWELQKSALEQFNGLRRELFDAAWRLADKYDFPDKYRLTEKQIRNYNEILMDTNDIRKYERLYDIKDCFEAYPYYWYYLGNAANMVYQSTDTRISEQTKEVYFEKAKEHFEKFDKVDTFSVLREDAIAASCCLEYVDLLDAGTERDKILGLIDKARAKCGKSNDVLQLCAMAYLRIGDYTSAEEIMRHLVMEDYNCKVNAQLLSAAYVGKIVMLNDRKARQEYESLALVVSPHTEYLLPCPKSENETAKEREALLLKTQNSYLEQQKQSLKKRRSDVIKLLSEKYEIQFNKRFPTKKEHSDNYYLPSNAEIRENDFVKFIHRNADAYISMLRDAEFPDNIVSDMRRLYVSVTVGMKLDDDRKRALYGTLVNRLYTDEIRELTSIVYDDYWESKLAKFKELIEQFTFASVTESFFNLLRLYAEADVNTVNSFSVLAQKESDTEDFCVGNDIHPADEAVIGKAVSTQLRVEFASLVAENIEAPNRRIISEAIGYLADMKDKLIRNAEKVRIILFDMESKKEAEEYWARIKKLRSGVNIDKTNVIAVLDNILNDNDLIFAAEGVYRVKAVKFTRAKRLQLIKYTDIIVNGEVKLEGVYDNESINISQLEKVILNIAQISELNKAE